jgi:hypothetical protein
MPTYPGACGAPAPATRHGSRQKVIGERVREAMGPGGARRCQSASEPSGERGETPRPAQAPAPVHQRLTAAPDHHHSSFPPSADRVSPAAFITPRHRPRDQWRAPCRQSRPSSASSPLLRGPRPEAQVGPAARSWGGRRARRPGRHARSSAPPTFQGETPLPHPAPPIPARAARTQEPERREPCSTTPPPTGSPGRPP